MINIETDTSPTQIINKTPKSVRVKLNEEPLKSVVPNTTVEFPVKDATANLYVMGDSGNDILWSGTIPTGTILEVNDLRGEVNVYQSGNMIPPFIIGGGGTGTSSCGCGDGFKLFIILLVIILLLGGIGALVYFFLIRKRGNALWYSHHL